MANTSNTTLFTEITFANIQTQIQNYLKQEYNTSNILFSEASPYGQILFVIENLFQLSLLYLKNTIKNLDLSNNNATNTKVIRSAAVVAGYIPGRAISATGNLLMTVKLTTDISSNIPGGKITLNNQQTLKNKTNGLYYSINLSEDTQTFFITKNTQIYLNIIQGKWTTTSFTGTGDINQTFNANIRSSVQDIENFNVQVLVDGIYWTTKTWLYDLAANEQSCVVRTGFSGGIDIIFGNGFFGAIPGAGSTIIVNYILSDGSNGNIFRRTINDWQFIDMAIDGFGNSIDVTKFFDISIYNDINFGADTESTQFTKNMLPISSNNFVLGLPQQYAFAIKRLGIFSYVNAYEQYGSIYIMVTPNIVLFKNQNSDYFSIPLAAFQLDSYEISKIDTYLKSSGNIMITRRYQILSPLISLYIINVFAIIYSDATQDNVTLQIHDAISNYFLDLTKIGRIPKADIISVLSAITDIYSFDINFVSKKNEDYHSANQAKIQYSASTAEGTFQLSTVQSNLGYTASTVIGIDPVLGDILFESNEIPVIKGGWYDRNDIYYSDDINSSGLKSVNVFYQSTVDSSQRPLINSN
jgi:hypothetical protein